MDVKLCNNCCRPMWEGKCLYEKGFLEGIEEGRKIQIEAEKIYMESKKPKIKMRLCKFKNCSSKFGCKGKHLPKFCSEHNEFNVSRRRKPLRIKLA